MKSMQAMCGSRGGGPPEKPQNVGLQYWSESPEKSQSYQASIQCWAIIGPSAFKWSFADGPMMAHL